MPSPGQFPGYPRVVHEHRKSSAERAPYRWRRHHHHHHPLLPPPPPPPPHDRYRKREKKKQQQRWNSHSRHSRIVKSGENDQLRSRSSSRERKASVIHKDKKRSLTLSLKPSTSSSTSAVGNGEPITAVGSTDWSLRKRSRPCPLNSTQHLPTKPNKKPRLGWGDGLANYEKKKLEAATDLHPPNLVHHITRLLLSHQPNSIDSNTLSELKAQALKAIEETESQIDSLETELTLLTSHPSTKASSKIVDVEEFSNLSKNDSGLVQDSTVDNDDVACNHKSVLASNNDSHKRASHFAQIKERLLARSRSQKFNDEVTILKLKVFHQFRNEGRQSSSTSTCKCKKNRLIGCSHASGGSHHRIVPVKQVLDFVNRQLLESRLKFKPCRDTLKMPTLHFDKGIKMPRLISKNSLVEDPCAVEKERSMINPWTPEESDIFIDKHSVYGKDFGKISSFIEHKTVADCIEFYYKNHKSERFEKVRKKIKSPKRSNTRYMVAAGERQNQEAKPDAILPETMHPKCLSGIVSREVCDSPSLDIDSNGNISYDDMSSCTMTSFDCSDGCHKLGLGISTPDVTLGDADDEFSDVTCWEMESANWSEEEKSAFIQAVLSYGKDFEMISQVIGTRSEEQCKLYFSKGWTSLGLDQIYAGAPSDGDEDAVFMSVSGMGEDHPASGAEVSCVSDIEETLVSSPHVMICAESSSSCPLGSMAVESALENHGQVVDDNPALDSTDGTPGPESGLEVRALVPFKSVKVENVDGISIGDASREGDDKVFPEYKSNGAERVEDGYSNSIEFAVDPRIVGNSPSNRVESGCKNEVGHEAVSAGQSAVIPPHQDDQFAYADSSLPFSPLKKYHEGSIRNYGTKETSEKQSQGIPNCGDCWEELPRYLQLDRILREYPALVQTVKEIKHGDVNDEKCGPLQNMLTSSQQQSELTQKSSFRSPAQSSSDGSSRPQSGCALKLFGKVIIPNSCQQATPNDYGSHQSENLRCNGDQGTYMDQCSWPKFEPPVMHARFPPFLDSTQFLAKYPAAFSNQNHYNIPMAKLDQQLQLQLIHWGLWNNHYHQMNTTTGTQLVAASAADYQTLINRELQQRQHTAFLSEMQRRNRIYLTPSNQASGMMLGTHNTTGAGFASGILGPVTAMKMQGAYPQPQSLGMQTRNAFGERLEYR